MIRLLLLALCVLPASLLARCPPLQGEALQQMHDRLITRGRWETRFEQKNHIHVLEQPLVSNGTVAVDPDRGVVWQVLSPIESRIEVSDAGLTIDAQSVAQSQLVAALLQALLSGDLGTLDQTFELRACVTDERWTLELLPRAEGFRQRLTGLTITGDDDLKTLEVEQPGGNTLHIEFEPPRALDAH